MLLELAPRGSLRDLLDTAPAEVLGSERTQMELAAGTASAMAFLHGQQPQPVLHHDLKSGNVLVFAAAEGRLCAKLTDFGLSLIASGSTLCSTTRAHGGTVAYQAPEQFDDAFTTASEVNAFAVHPLTTPYTPIHPLAGLCLRHHRVGATARQPAVGGQDGRSDHARS